ncbi:MAG: thiamine-phosphate kinase, partial [Desulfobacteraceae bacterium]
MTDTLADIGEFGLIDRIRRLLREEGAEAEGLAAGPGDDAAVMSIRPGFQLLATCDSMVEGRHFIPGSLNPVELGRRAMVMNISDIAAMGGVPRFALASLGLRPETPLEEIEGLYRGFLDELNPLGAVLAGGNITKSGDGVFFDITVIGEIPFGQAVLRSGARPGDAIMVSGFPGEAAAGLELLLAGERLDGPDIKRLVEAYRSPSHRAG